MATGAVMAIVFAPSFCGVPLTPIYPANVINGLLRPSDSEDGEPIGVSMANLEKEF